MEMFDKFKNASFFNNMFLKIKKTEEVIKEKENKADTIQKYVFFPTWMLLSGLGLSFLPFDSFKLIHLFPITITIMCAAILSLIVSLLTHIYTSKILTKNSNITLNELKQEFMNKIKSDKKLMEDIFLLVVDERTEKIFIELVNMLENESYDNFYDSFMLLIKYNNQAEELKQLKEKNENIINSFKKGLENEKLRHEKLKELYKL